MNRPDRDDELYEIEKILGKFDECIDEKETELEELQELLDDTYEENGKLEERVEELENEVEELADENESLAEKLGAVSKPKMIAHLLRLEETIRDIRVAYEDVLLEPKGETK